MKKVYLFIVTLFLLHSCKNTFDEKAEKLEEPVAKIESIAFPSPEKSQTPYLVATDNNLYLSWQETIHDSIYRFKFSKLVENSFSKPQLITSGTNWFVNWADYPILSENNGVMLANTLQKSATGTYTYDVMLNLQVNQNSKWSDAFVLHDDNTQAEHGFVSMIPYKDGFFVTWLDGRNTVNVSEEDRAMNLRGAFVDKEGKITDDILLDDKICDCCQTTAIMTQDGPAVIYRDRSDAEVRDMSIVKYENGNWTTPKPVYNDKWKINGCPVNGPRADALGASVAVAWFTSANDNSKVNVAFSNNNGETFREPKKVDLGNPLGRVDLALVSKNKAIVSWLENDKILARTVTENGNLGAVITIAESSKSRASGFPQMVIFKDTVYFAWTSVDEHRNSTIQVGTLSVREF